MNVLVDGEIMLFGTVGAMFFDEGFTAMDVVTALSQVGRNKDVTVRINSGGGIATEGLAIFNALDSHRGKVTVVVESIAASAASIIAMAGDDVVMKTGASMMVHDPAAFTMGNSEDHSKSVEMLEVLAASMADIYAEKTGRKRDDIRKEMKDETWMTAKEAVAKGYADKIEKGRSKEPTAFDYALYQHAPERMVALAESRGWKHPGEKAESSATTRQTEEIDMTDAEKVAADKLAADKAAAEAKVKAEAEAKAKADAEAKAAADAGIEAERKRAADIVAACTLAGQPQKAPGFISEGKSLSEVVAALQADRKPTADVTTRHPPAGDKLVSASWDKHVERLNARIKNGVAA